MGSLGDRLVKLRQEKNLNQKEAAKQIGITAVNLSRYEKNNRVPNKETLHKLAAFYHVSPSYIYFGEEKVNLDFLEDVTEKEARLLKEYLKEIREKNDE